MRVVVIGGGVLGASTAFHLARDGTSVTLIDAAHDGRATAAGAGIVCPWVSGADDGPVYRLYEGGACYYPELVAALAALDERNLGYARVGGLCVGDDAQELDAIAKYVVQRAAVSPQAGEVHRLSAAQTRALFPPLREGSASVLVTGGARVDGRRLNAALLRAATKCGAKIEAGTAELRIINGHVIGVRVGNALLEADVVVLAAGAWAPELLESYGVTLPVAPMRGQIVHLHLPGVDTQNWPVVLPPGEHYLLAFEESRVVVGATREAGAGFDYRVTAAGQAAVLLEALRVAPGLAAATVLETRVGFRPASTDGLPLLGFVHGIEGLVVGNGLGAVGLTIGPFAGKVLADVILGRDMALDLTDFDPLRRRGLGRRGIQR